jgi:WD40 repeat protein
MSLTMCCCAGCYICLKILQGDDDYVSSVQFIPDGGSHVAIGTSKGQTQLWDVNTRKQVLVHSYIRASCREYA